MQTLIITSAVFVNSNLTVLTDPALREQQYADSILFYLQTKNISRIIVCDNSGFDFSLNGSLAALAKANGKALECLSFLGNKDLVKAKGKGYGEGEIMDYVFRNSKLLKEAPGFFKVTGRVRVLNIDRLITHIHPGTDYFQRTRVIPLGDTYWNAVDTRLYYCTREVFSRYLQDAYGNVDDQGGYYLEHAYYARLAGNMIPWESFKVFPRYSGISGSTGKTYAAAPVKWQIQRIICSFVRIFLPVKRSKK
jgi:hypothetical protein